MSEIPGEQSAGSAVPRSGTSPGATAAAINGSRPDAAHYSVDIEQVGRFSWRWHVVHWPETYRGSNGRVYPSLDWRKTGTALTCEKARREVEKAIALRREELGWRDSRESFNVVA